MRNPKVIFIELDNVLIHTRSGKSFQQGIWDMTLDLKVFAKLKESKPEYIFIISNQGGIGRFFTEAEFEAKLDYVTVSLKSYVRHSNLIDVNSIYCASVDKNDPYRKPNTGMLEYMLKLYSIDCQKNEMLMIGYSSGKVGQSDIDIMTAKNFGIRYLDINEFIKTYFE